MHVAQTISKRISLDRHQLVDGNDEEIELFVDSSVGKLDGLDEKGHENNNKEEQLVPHANT